MISPLRDHQVKALRKLTNGKVLWGGVGSGKTRVAVEYYKKEEAPRDVYVITTAKKRDDFDWQQEFYEWGVGPKSGPVGASHIPGNSRSDVQAELPDGPGDAVHSGRGLGSDVRGRDLGSRVRARGISEVHDSGSVHPGHPRETAGGEESSGGRDAFDRGGYPWVLTVDSWNNIGKYGDVAGAFFIFDEQRLVGSGKWARTFLRIAKRNTWILLSATPGDTWLDYIPLFVANGFYKNRTEFLRKHVVYNNFSKFPKVDHFINVGILAKHRSDILVEMPFERHTRRRHVVVPLPYDKEQLDIVLKERWHVYEDRPLNDVNEMFLVARRVVNSDPSRLAMVEELWQNHPRLIVFYNFNFELMSLRSLSSSFPSASPIATGGRTTTASSGSGASTSSAACIDGTRSTGISADLWTPSSNSTSFPTSQISSSTVTAELSTKLMSPVGTTDSLRSRTEPASLEKPSTMVSEWNGHRHQPVPDTDRWLYLVQYTAGAEGWNCITTDAMIMYSRNYSWKVTEQAYGRIDRLNTLFRDLWYYGFTSNSFVDKAIERSIAAKEDFNVNKYRSLFED